MTTLTLRLVGKTPITLIRRPQGTYVDGDYIKGVSTAVDILANVQQIQSAKDTTLLPEADRSKAAVKLYTSSEIRQLKEGETGWGADQFYWDGELYEVMSSVPWKMGVQDHYKAICSRKELRGNESPPSFPIIVAYQILNTSVSVTIGNVTNTNTLTPQIKLNTDSVYTSLVSIPTNTSTFEFDSLNSLETYDIRFLAENEDYILSSNVLTITTL